MNSFSKKTRIKTNHSRFESICSFTSVANGSFEARNTRSMFYYVLMEGDGRG